MSEDFDDGERLPEETTADNLPAAPDDNADRKEEIQTLMADQGGDYWQGPKAERLQAEYRNLLGAEVPAGDLIEVEGFRTPTLAEADGWGLDATAGRESVNRAMMILDNVPEADREYFDTSIAGLSDDTRGAMIAELSQPRPEDTTDASPAVLSRLEAHGCGRVLQEWGIGAPRRVGIAEARVNAVIDAIPSDEEASEFVRWFDNLTGPEMSAILRATA